MKLNELHLPLFKRSPWVVGCSLIIIMIVGVSIFLQASRRGETKETITMDTNRTTSTQTSLLNGTWQYMPGVKQTPQGLLVSPLKFEISEQDGSNSQMNPRINLAGTHPEGLVGDFSITADVQLQNSTGAQMQFYGRVPIIADEFRIERESIQVGFENNKIVVKIWEGFKQQPREVRTFLFAPQKTLKFTLSQKGQDILFIINNKQIGKVRKSHIFDEGKVWLGLESRQGEWLIGNLSVNYNNKPVTLVDTSTLRISENIVDGLQILAEKKRPGFIIGASQSLNTLVSDPQYAQIALDKNNFGSLTPENGMKMINLQPERGIYSFEYADALVKLAKQNGLSVHGHTLVFGEALPMWFSSLPTTTDSDKAQIEKIMLDHITTVVKHFGIDVMSWDVVNEPLSDYDDFENGQILRTHKWYQAMGKDYIIKALNAAHKANPEAILFINEFGLEDDGDRWDSFVSILKNLKPELERNNIPVEKVGIGFQAHIYEAGDKINPQILRNHLKQLEEMGFKAQISELDVYSDDGDQVQADQYKKAFEACLSEKNCIAWRIWILSDKYDFWKDDSGIIQPGIDGLYDSVLKPRPALSAINQILK